MSEWISVQDRLPLELDSVASYRTELVIATDGETVGFAVFEAGNGGGSPWRGFSAYSDYSGSITHWMPLPPSPQELQP